MALRIRQNGLRNRTTGIVNRITDVLRAGRRSGPVRLFYGQEQSPSWHLVQQGKERLPAGQAVCPPMDPMLRPDCVVSCG